MNISDMAQKFTELLLDASIDAMAIAGELIINRLIRKNPDTDFRRPDFTKEELEPYQIYTVLKALEKNESPLIGISSQNIKRQLLSDELVTKKTGTSYIDAFFMESLPTSRYLEIKNMIENQNKKFK